MFGPYGKLSSETCVPVLYFICIFYYEKQYLRRFNHIKSIKEFSSSDISQSFYKV